MHFLLTRWPVYFIFILFVIFNIIIEYKDTGTTTLRNIQLGCNIFMFVLILVYIFSTGFYSKIKTSLSNLGDYSADSSRHALPI
jgi:hypothetical protein